MKGGMFCNFSRLIIVLAALAMAVGDANVSAQSSREYEIKAAFLYNFVKFVEWPAQALPESNPSITICVLGDNPFGAALDSIKDKTVKGKKLVIRRTTGVQDLESCHMLFISSSEEKRLPQIVKSLQMSSVLTVGEMEGFAQLGGIINLFLDKNKVRFEINVDVAERSGLRISSRLLNLARVVRSESRGN